MCHVHVRSHVHALHAYPRCRCIEPEITRVLCAWTLEQVSKVDTGYFSNTMASVDDPILQHSIMVEHSQARKRRRTEDMNGQTSVSIYL